MEYVRAKGKHPTASEEVFGEYGTYIRSHWATDDQQRCVVDPNGVLHLRGLQLIDRVPAEDESNFRESVGGRGARQDLHISINDGLQRCDNCVASGVAL